MKDTVLDKFSRVILDIGVDVKPGQNLVINAPTEALDLVRKLTLAAYKDKHVRYVIPNFTDEHLSDLKLNYADEEYLNYVPQWEHDYLEERSNEDMAEINIRTCQPKSGQIDRHRFSLAENASIQIRKGYRKNFNSAKINWCTLLYPTKEWACAVYPECDEDSALKKLWNDFIKINRLDCDDPITAWNVHLARIAERKKKLDDLNIELLHFEGGGTDLYIRLVKNGHWAGGFVKSGGKEFVPNIPTEEVFHLPHKFGVNGKVKATIPLNYKGNLIEGLKMEFKDGEIISYSADRGEEIIKTIIETDEGARHLGEVALVSVDSPIYQSKRIFQTTLYDENAVCHIAIGNYASCVIDNIEEMTIQEANARGITKSLLHVDFMIGSEEVDVKAYDKVGTETLLMKNGKWCI